MSRNTSTLAEIGDAVTDGLNDAWAATAAFAHDLAASAVDTASGLGTAASGGLAEGADRVSSLYEQARHQIRPPQRRVKPWMYVAVALVAIAGVGWWVRRRRAATSEASHTHLSPVAGHTETARAAAGH